MKLSESQRSHFLAEIDWLNAEISKLTEKLQQKPSVQRQINEYKRQIVEREMKLLFL